MFKYIARSALPAIFFGGLAAVVPAKEPCGPGDIVRPQAPALIEADLSLLRGEDGRPALPEWSKVEKLRDFYRQRTVEQAPCLIVEGGEIAVRLFVAHSSLALTQPDETAGQFTADKGLQFYGASRVKVERADQSVTREFAFPLEGPVPISDVASEEQVRTLLEDMAQLRLVSVPRFRPQKASESAGVSCFLLNSATLVPSRVFDEPAANEETPPAHLTLDARRQVLEHLAREVKWQERIDTEQPGCRTSEADGYLGRQITSLNLTVGELIPDIDFVAESIRFWKRVEERIQELLNEEEPWMKEISR